MGSFAVAVGVVVPIIPHISVGEKYLRIYSKIFAIMLGREYAKKARYTCSVKNTYIMKVRFVEKNP